MQIFSLLENKFEQLNFRLKIEIFLLPILLIGFFYYFEKSFFIKKEYEDKRISIEKEKNMSKNFIDIIKDIENYLSKNKINLHNLSNENQIIKIAINTSLIKQLNFLEFLEKYNSYSHLHLVQLRGSTLSLELNFRKFYVKKIEDKKSILEKIKQYEQIKNEFILQAIVGENVLINKKWKKLNDFIDGFKIISIEKNSVILEKNTFLIESKVYNNEAF
ncbi:hypothetical protein CP965_04690 [Halarcobacter mediterraneus]|uniref:Transformation system protein n=1 Tax=Halarcobacter mediterraneus TaxID=2023153 RepID=A0A4Q1ATB0_9BACT|nr:hypothetical protein [Halarcobacter mediterraneus]RXK13102.1 hypothetical protein CP965_04690 [Halarcobacter mediterraneus]